MKIKSKLIDKKINAINILFHLTIGEYLDIAEEILRANPYQRKRVSPATSKTVYGLLKDDLIIGCVIPPIVLALQTDESFDLIEKKSNEEIESILEANKKNFLILDGLQRTYTLGDANTQIHKAIEVARKDGNEKELAKLTYEGKNFLAQEIRIETYVGINKTGILYRMITLNTGQTPMSIRHQIEILYSEYLHKIIPDIKLWRESDGRRNASIGNYRFNEVIDGYLSYLSGDEQSVDKDDILDDIKGIENLIAGANSDSFVEFIITYHELVKVMMQISNGFNVDESIRGIIKGAPFGTNAENIFTNQQIITGFGAAIRKQIELGNFKSIVEIKTVFSKIKMGNDINETYIELLKQLEKIRKDAPKIGSYQRLYLKHFFRVLFDKEKPESYLSIFPSIEIANARYARDI